MLASLPANARLRARRSPLMMLPSKQARSSTMHARRAPQAKPLVRLALSTAIMTTTKKKKKKTQPSVVARSSSSSAAPSPSPSSASDDKDFLSQGLLKVLYPTAAALLGLAGVAMVAAPSKFAATALLSCPLLPPPATAIQLAGASLSVPCAACVALGNAAEVGPKRLSSATYVALNAGVALFGLAVAASVSAAVAGGSAVAAAGFGSAAVTAAKLAPSKLFSSLASFGPLLLALSCSTAATAYGGQGAGVARALAQAPVAVAAAVRRAAAATPTASAEEGAGATAARLFGASSGALAAVATAAAIVSSSADVTSALFLRVAASGTLFASVAAAVLSDAASRGRSGASTFVKLKTGGVAGSAAAAGATVGGAVASFSSAASASSSSLAALAPALGVSAALLLFGGTCAWQLATVVGKK